MMTAVRERGREARDGTTRAEGSRATDWKAVVAAHHVQDWPPPEWLAALGETAASGVSGA